MEYTINYTQVPGLSADEDFVNDIESKVSAFFKYVIGPEDKLGQDYIVDLYTEQEGSKVWLHIDFFNTMYNESMYHLKWCIAC